MPHKICQLLQEWTKVVIYRVYPNGQLEAAWVLASGALDDAERAALQCLHNLKGRRMILQGCFAHPDPELVVSALLTLLPLRRRGAIDWGRAFAAPHSCGGGPYESNIREH